MFTRGLKSVSVCRSTLYYFRRLTHLTCDVPGIGQQKETSQKGFHRHRWHGFLGMLMRIFWGMRNATWWRLCWVANTRSSEGWMDGLQIASRVRAMQTVARPRNDCGCCRGFFARVPKSCYWMLLAAQSRRCPHCSCCCCLASGETLSRHSTFLFPAVSNGCPPDSQPDSRIRRLCSWPALCLFFRFHWGHSTQCSSIDDVSFGSVWLARCLLGKQAT